MPNMISPQFTKPDYSCIITSMEIRSGRRLKSCEPDKDGYFVIPCAVFDDDTASDNGRYFPSARFHFMHTDPNGLFHKTLTRGQLHGEHGHPMDPSPVRQATMDPDKVCWHIRKFFTKEIQHVPGHVGFLEVKPCGPYGEYVRSSFLDGQINTGCSVRMLGRKMNAKAGGFLFWPTLMPTYDYVPAGGYEVASKRFSSDVDVIHEHLSVPVDPVKLRAELKAMDEVASQSIRIPKPILAEMLGADEVVIKHQSYAIDPSGDGIYNKETNEQKHLFHTMWKG